MKLKANVSSSRKLGNKLQVGKELVGVEAIVLGAHRGRCSDELTSRKTELKKGHVRFAAKMEFIELLKGRIVAMKTSFGWEPKTWKIKISKAKWISHETLTEIKGDRGWPGDEVDQLFLVMGAVSVEVKKSRRMLTRAQEEIGILVDQAATHKQSAEDTERLLNDGEYQLDGARARITQLPSSETLRL